MSYAVILTRQAQFDLKEVFNYISDVLQSRRNASAQLDRLEKAIMSLHDMSERFRVCDADKWRERNLRIMPVDNYLLFYIPERDTNTVNVIRVMYGGRDIAAQLNNSALNTHTREWSL